MARPIKKDEGTAANRRIFIVLVDSNGAFVTGFTPAGAEIQVSKNGAAYANFAGTLTELSDGAYYYEPTAGEVNTLGLLILKFEKASIRTAHFEALVVGYDPNASIPTVAEVADGVWDEARAGHVGAGSFGEGVVVNSLSAAAITAIQSGLATAADVAGVAAAAATAVWGYTIEGAFTAVQIFRGIGRKVLGKATGQEGATHTYRDLSDTKDSLVDSYSAGNRTPTTRDLT